MSAFGRGRADYLELGDWNAVCYQCGRKRKASTMLKHWQGYYVCPEHWEPRQPQDFVRSIPDVQTPPWTQPMPGNAYAKDFINISASDLTAGDYTVTYTSGDGPASGGAVTVIVTVQQGVTIGTLTIDNTWPVGSTIIINNYGVVGAVTNNSGITPTVNNTGLYPGIPWQIAFTTQPSNVAPNTAISPAVVVTVQDYLSNTVTSWPNAIVITLSLGANPGGAVLAGTLSATTSSGVATFSDLTLDQIADSYTLVAQGSDGATGTDLFFPTPSSTFNVGGWTLVAVDLSGIGNVFGFQFGLGGSITPTTLSSAFILALLTTDITSSPPGSTVISIAGSLAQDFFTSLTVNGVTFLAATATYPGVVGGATTWTWTGTPSITSAATYPVIIT